MRKIIGCIAIIMVAAGVGACERLKEMRDEVIAAAASSSTPDAVPVDKDYLLRQLQSENKAMAAAPGFASRRGNTLTLTYDGKSVASFTAGNYDWTFKGTISVTDERGKSDRLALVYFDEGEIGYTAIVRRNGTLVVLDGQILASPDGHFIASGDGDIQYDSKMRIVKWLGDAAPESLVIPANCSPVAWQGNTLFTVDCVVEGTDSLMTVGKVSRRVDGQWVFTETRELSLGDSNDPFYAKLKMRTETAKAERLTTDKDTAFCEANGYKRLTP